MGIEAAHTDIANGQLGEEVAGSRLAPGEVGDRRLAVEQ